MWKNFITFLKWSVSNDKKQKKTENVSGIIRRARNKKGQYEGDDKETPNVNEAWEGGTAPKKRGRPPKYKKNL